MFRYGFTTSKYPEFKDKFCQVNIIDAPLSKEKYWSKEFINGKENPSFNQMMHVIGHFLHNCICLEDFRNYSFLSNKCNGSEKYGFISVMQKEIFSTKVNISLLVSRVLIFYIPHVSIHSKK